MVIVVGLPIGLLAGQGVNRSLSLGFYLLGSFLAVAGFFIGNRGPLRPREDTDTRLGRSLRRASRDEQADSITVSSIFVVLGFTLIVIGILIDARHELV